MNRFWVFPLVLGLAGALYGAACDAQGWLAYYLCLGGPVPFRAWQEVGDVWRVSALWGSLLGLFMGAYAAWSEMLRFGTRDRSGWNAAGRLMSNGWWVGFYSLIANIGTLALAWTLLKAGVLSGTIFRFWFPAFFFLPFGVVNFSAILWAAMRTASTDDVLSPRVLLAKLQRSTQVTG